MQLFLYLGNFKFYVIILKYFLNDDKQIFQFCHKYYVKDIYLFIFVWVYKNIEPISNLFNYFSIIRYRIVNVKLIEYSTNVSEIERAKSKSN
jgi:hypothetical protein